MLVIFKIIKSFQKNEKYKNSWTIQRNFHNELGINGRIDTLQCAILLEKLKIFKKEIKLRKKYLKYMKDIFKKQF